MGGSPSRAEVVRSGLRVGDAAFSLLDGAKEKYQPAAQEQVRVLRPLLPPGCWFRRARAATLPLLGEHGDRQNRRCRMWLQSDHLKRRSAPPSRPPVPRREEARCFGNGRVPPYNNVLANERRKGNRQNTLAVVGQFHDVNFTAEPGGLPAVGRHLPPDGQAAQTPRGRCHGARRELPISKMSHYPRSLVR